MPTMKALVFETYGPPSVLSFESREIPAPKAGEVLVKVAASAINPSDVKNVAGHFKAPRPRVPGRYYAGVIVAGDGPIGAAVWGSGPGFGVARDGAHQEYFVMPASWIALKPPKLGVEEAASIGVPYLAAWSALISAAKLEPGETVLVACQEATTLDMGGRRP